MGIRRKTVLIALLALAPPTLVADDLSGEDVLLCSATQATVCTAEGECNTGPPWNWNIPQFVEVNLKGKIVSTTKASGENRSTPIKNMERKDGLLVLQGVENRRAFSFVVEETTGNLSAAVAREEITVSVFGGCTPMPEGKE